MPTLAKQFLMLAPIFDRRHGMSHIRVIILCLAIHVLLHMKRNEKENKYIIFDLIVNANFFHVNFFHVMYSRSHCVANN